MSIAVKSLKSLEFDKICGLLSGYAKTSMSKHLCLDLNCNSIDVRTALQYTKEAKDILDLAIDIPIEFVAEVNKILTQSGILSEEEIIDCAKTLRTSRLVKNFLKENSIADGLLNSLAVGLWANKDLEDKILETFDENFNVKSDASAELKGLYSSLKDNEKNLKSKVTELLNSPSFSKYLQEQIYTMRDDRIVFQVKASAKNHVGGIVHDTSATSRTLYIEPAQIVPLNNKVREIKSAIRAEILRILAELTKLLKTESESLIISSELLAQIDFHFAKARFAVKLRAVEPEVCDEKIIKFESMRHPLLIGNVEHIVENDFEMGKDYQAVVITGSNTGGKTVTLKSVGLFILMAKAGMFLPCGMARLYPFKNVFADIGDEQSILQNLSTFSSHMKNIISIVNNCDNETLILIDEICAGTDPQEGAVLAEVILEKFADKKSFAVVTTHYGELKALEYNNKYFRNACVEFDTESLKPTYKLTIGIPGLSNAISISSNLGLSNDLVKKAREILTSQRDSSVLVVEQLQETQAQMTENLKEAEELKISSQELKKKYEKEVSSLKKDKKKTIKHIKDKFDSQIDDAKAEIKDILKELRANKSEKIARRSYARLAKLEQGFHQGINQLNEQETYSEIDWSKVNIGDKLMLKDLHQDVELLSMPDKNDIVFVQMGTMKTKIKTSKLACFDGSMVKKSALPKQSMSKFELRRREMSNTLDLRGYRVEDALDELEKYLDDASLANLTPVYIIHGHGTGALKSSVRDFISTSPYVAKYRAGEPSEGGDGVSIIDIN